MLEILKGQPIVLEYLSQAINKRRIAPAYLFTGIDGIGKALAARVFTEMITGKDATKELRIQPIRSDRTRALPNIKIEQIKTITHFLATPSDSRKIVIVEDSHTMGESAANALLKTLEEPGLATIILTANSVHNLLPTIVSRCQIIPFKPLSKAILMQVLQDNGYADILNSPYQSILDISQGSPGKAIALYKTMLEIQPEIMNMVKANSISISKAMTIAKTLSTLPSHHQSLLLDYMQYHYFPHRLDTVHYIEKSKQALNSYTSPRLVWECLYLHLADQLT